VEEALALLAAHLRVGIAENESNGCEEVTLAGTIASDNYIGFVRKRFNDCLILVAV
jgi:hypothetical protein